MRSAELRTGRVFVLKLDEGEVLNEVVESFCRDNGIVRATVSAVGGASDSSILVVGPELPIRDRISPQTCSPDGPCELTAFGTVFPDSDGNPVMHMHGSLGRSGGSVTGCFRKGVVVWLTMEVVVTELLGEGPARTASDPRLDGKLLEIRRWHRKRF
ncbi:MAG: DNA-binding protein [Candidatus Methanomethylophilaceae archaeon]|nr:DNA-binding protein [Candidatus Methanomethylophilaceae archaeon]